MTYCVGMLLSDGLVMLADTRTNAGIDDVASHRKLHIIPVGGARSVMISTAGSLSVSQAALHLLDKGVADPGGEAPATLAGCGSIIEAAHLVGRAILQARDDFKAATAEGVQTDATFLLGGRIGEEPLRLFMIYAEGNWIECDADTPFLQIGEHKYGKPILDRALTYDTELLEGVKIGLLSMDATLRSNLSVGLPIDIAALSPDGRAPEVEHRVGTDDAYFRELGVRWAEALLVAERSIPAPPY